MRAGALRHEVAIQQRSTSTDAIGGQVDTWSTLATLQAEVRPMQGRELLAARTIATEVTYKITLRYNSIFADPKTAATYRVSYDSRIFNVHAIINQGERDREISLLASEGLTNG